MAHICVSDLTMPGRRQAIIWINAGILLIGPLETLFNEILIGILICSFKKMRLKVSSVKRRPFCLGVNVLRQYYWCRWMADESSNSIAGSSQQNPTDNKQLLTVSSVTSKDNLSSKILIWYIITIYEMLIMIWKFPLSFKIHHIN